VTGVTNLSRGTVLADRAETARSPWAQFKGLMGRAELAQGTGLVFPGTRGVHTHFMRFPIDVVFFNRDGVVVGVEHAIRPWRFSAYHLSAKGAIPAGTARATRTQPGDRLRIAEVSASLAQG
jgi:uncharacterized membrane protein (UPF0127 family)